MGQGDAKKYPLWNQTRGICLAEEGAVWEGSFCQIKRPVTGRSVVHAFSRNVVFFVELSQTKDAKSSNSLITYDFCCFLSKKPKFHHSLVFSHEFATDRSHGSWRRKMIPSRQLPSQPDTSLLSGSTGDIFCATLYVRLDADNRNQHGGR
ncbi:hypothetical protein L596_009382 [Steinernema carpocapsae]|uniref:Uncharacterized protein n=1 Tax=Steinernema carpocapsae TaxID=34508 RepID=A0A4U5PFG9_STECR|nr:hypothetical protein L596_009382 [Steinernema carpocapsae]